MDIIIVALRQEILQILSLNELKVACGNSFPWFHSTYYVELKIYAELSM